MKKSFWMISALMLLLACGGKKTQGESVDAASDSIPVQRQQYRFEHQFIMADDENCDSIVVKGYQDGKLAFECCHQLTDYMSAKTAANIDWINDTVDINFDGIPDLQIFLTCYVRGQVIEYYAGYVWTPQQKFEEVEQWKELCNPEVHPEDKTVTAYHRVGFNEITNETYKWIDGNKLELIKTSDETIYDDDPFVQEITAVKNFVQQFYDEWDMQDLHDYDKLKPYITANLRKYLADAYDYECEGECLATWKFFYEGGGDVGEMRSSSITPRDENHVLVEFKYENYEYGVLLKVVRDGETFKIDSLTQEQSEYNYNH